MITELVDAVVADRPDRERPGRVEPPTRLTRAAPRTGLLFVAPWLIGLSLFYLIPLVASLVFSFTNYEFVDQDDNDRSSSTSTTGGGFFDDPRCATQHS